MAKAVNTSPAGGMKWGRQPNAAEKIRAEKQNHSKSKVSGLSSWVTGEAELKMGFVIVGIVLFLAVPGADALLISLGQRSFQCFVQ